MRTNATKFPPASTTAMHCGTFISAALLDAGVKDETGGGEGEFVGGAEQIG